MLAFLHLVAVVHDSVREMLVNVVGTLSDTIELTGPIESKFQHRVDVLRDSDPVSKRLLADLGCWPGNAK